MASMEQQFKDAMMADADAASDPTEVTKDEPDQGGDAVCPMCGASAMKIVQATQGGGGGMSGGMSGGMGMKT